jgi:pimeloyl-ACP methyl ester carboxylesterase
MTAANLPVARVETSRGDFYLRSDRDFVFSNRPMVLVLHGALRHSMKTQVWLPVLVDRYDVVLLDLPGHGYTPASGEASIAAFAGRVGAFVRKYCQRRPCVILGESIGGLIGLALADGRFGEIRGVIAADPPLTTSKQWAVRSHIVKSASKTTDFLREFYANTFGFVGEKIVREHIYYGLLAKVRTPTLLLTGDLALFPVRPLPKQIPCLIDSVDKAVIEALNNPNLSLEIVKDSGHLCMDANNPQARGFVTNFCLERLGSGAAPTQPVQARADAGVNTLEMAG